MRTWIEERYLRIAYWLLAKCRSDRHSKAYNDRVNDAQLAIAEIVCVYYSAGGKAVGNR